MSEIALKTQGLSKKYGSFVALAPLNLEVKRGEIFGYLGPNGAGKTTTIRAILGLINPTSGSAKILGIDSQQDKQLAHQKITYVPGEATFWPNLTGAETLHLLGQIHGQIDKQYQKLLIERFKFEPNKKIRSYSKGNRQKINIIAAFSTRAELLIMDEPTSGLDPIMEQAFRSSALEAKKNNQTIFLSSHVLEEVEALCDRVGILKEGKLVEVGRLSEMKHLSALSVEATFTSKPPDISNLKGVTNINVIGKQLTCQVNGPIDELLNIIAKA
ncbi:MAG TPA: ABC transporter ATP-binding protein, partial [Patescibacteria group bacterium]|nr:ABC transporter ATP-binding protein [Patescibacteria group bacterium]